MKKETMLAELADRGYVIELQPYQLDGRPKARVLFRSTTYSGSYECPRVYPMDEWTPDEVRLDCVDELLQWAGMRVVETLEYI